MRKRSAYRPRPVTAWMPHSDRRNIELMAYYLAPKLAAGLFDDVDGNTLAYTLNLARTLAVNGGYLAMVSTIDTAMQAFLGIRKRKERLGKWGAAGEELLILEEHLPNIAAWMVIQPVHRIEAARHYVLRINEKMRDSGALFADVTSDGDLENVVAADPDGWDRIKGRA